MITFCYKGLPDAASIEAASWVEPDNDRTVLIDASTAFRVNDDWEYGFPGMFIPKTKHLLENKTIFLPPFSHFKYMYIL